MGERAANDRKQRERRVFVSAPGVGEQITKEQENKNPRVQDKRVLYKNEGTQRAGKRAM